MYSEGQLKLNLVIIKVQKQEILNSTKFKSDLKDTQFIQKYLKIYKSIKYSCQLSHLTLRIFYYLFINIFIFVRCNVYENIVNTDPNTSV